MKQNSHIAELSEKYNSTDTFYITIFNGILKLAPIVGAAAAITFTIARLAGFFSFVDRTSLLCFDLVCLSYFVIAYSMRKYGIIRNGVVDYKRIFAINLVLDAVVLIQWNIITYVFPTKSFWGYAPMFVLLTAFLFNSKAVLIEIIGITVSILISWNIIGDKLLPDDDGLLTENYSLQVVALFISFSVIYILTVFAEKFTVLVNENLNSLSEKNKELEKASKEVIDFTADLIEERDSTSGTHVKRMKTYVGILARQIAKDFPKYELDDEKIEQIVMASVLHDVGKIAISDSILLKPGKLTAEEFEIIKTHTTLGAKIIDKLPDSVGEGYKHYCREICLFHHEKYDGKGYPAGLVGDDIPISAQIVSVVDCFDALSTERPYKAAFPKEKAINMILNGECGTFSDEMKACIVACKDKLINS